jgi:hypothetical protein
MRPELPIGPAGVSILTQAFREIENNGYGQDVILTRQFDQGLPRLRLNICGIDDRQLSAAQASAHDLVEQFEGVTGGRLIILVV